MMDAAAAEVHGLCVVAGGQVQSRRGGPASIRLLRGMPMPYAAFVDDEDDRSAIDMVGEDPMNE